MTPDSGHRSPSTRQHRHEAPDAVNCWAITVSDTRTRETDRGGALIEELLVAANHAVLHREIVTDDIEAICHAVKSAQRSPVDAIIVTGGSGISSRDVTPEAIEPLIEKELPGFGEMFRVLSWEEVGPATMLSRAFAGVLNENNRRTLIFVLPGSTNAVRLAMEKLIVPELGHLVREIRK